MKSLQTVQRQTGFETLEAKKLFAADLMGTAAADLPDTPVVAGFDPGDLVAEFDPGDLVSVEMNPGDAATGGFSHAENLSGQEVESVVTAVTPNSGISQVHHIKPHGSAGSYSDYPEVTEQHEHGVQEGEPVTGNIVSDWKICIPTKDERIGGQGLDFIIENGKAVPADIDTSVVSGDVVGRQYLDGAGGEALRGGGSNDAALQYYDPTAIYILE